jgi:cyclopropane fatty-acyl-phospholipid synthase-like methyltransferase
MNERVKKEREYWDNIVKENRFDMIFDPVPTAKELQDWIMQFIEKKNNEEEFVVVEYGCATGRISSGLSIDNSFLYGLDISNRMVNFCNFNKGLNSSKFYLVTDGRTFDIRFDFLYSITVFQHIDDEGIKEILKEMKRNMNKGGSCLIQFVEGTEKTEFSWQRSEMEMYKYALEAGFNSFKVMNQFLPNWRWMLLK